MVAADLLCLTGFRRMILRQGLPSSVKTHDMLRSRCSGRCLGGISNQDTTETALASPARRF
jgi:hypothetical protein